MSRPDDYWAEKKLKKHSTILKVNCIFEEPKSFQAEIQWSPTLMIAQGNPREKRPNWNNERLTQVWESEGPRGQHNLVIQAKGNYK